MDKPWKVISAFVGVFIAGAVFGGFFTLRTSAKRFAERRPAERETIRLPVPPAPQAQTPGPKVGPAPQVKAPVVMRQMNQRLNLTAGQREKIRPITERAAEDLQRLRQEYERSRQENIADTTRVTERMYSDIAALLSPEQRADLDAMRKQMQERAEQDRKRRAEAVAAAAAAQAETAKSAAPNAGRSGSAPAEKAPVEAPAENRK